MEVLEHGRYTHIFRCRECECIFSATCFEFEIEKAYDVDKHTTEYLLRTRCPECNAITSDLTRRSKDIFFGKEEEIYRKIHPGYPFDYELRGKLFVKD